MTILPDEHTAAEAIAAHAAATQARDAIEKAVIEHVADVGDRCLRDDCGPTDEDHERAAVLNAALDDAEKTLSSTSYALKLAEHAYKWAIIDADTEDEEVAR